MTCSSASANGDFGSTPPGWRDYGSISAVSLATGTPVWKDMTPQPERGGVTTTASGLGFDGGGDGVLRVFDVQTGKILWTFQTGHQIAAGASIYSVNGTEYVAITVGGTPTSSGGGRRPSCRCSRSPAPPQSSAPVIQPGPAPARHPHTGGAGAARAPPTSSGSHAAAQGVATIVTPAAVVVVPWQADSSNVQTLTGRLLWNGKPVVGADVTVDSYQVPQPTDKQGRFSYDIDNTVAGRHVDPRHRARRGDDRRQAAQRRAGAGGLGGDRRLHERLRDQRPARLGAAQRRRARHRQRHGLDPRSAAGGPSAQLRADRQDHVRRRPTGGGRDRDHAHAGSRLLDALEPLERQRLLLIVLHRLG